LRSLAPVRAIPVTERRTIGVAAILLAFGYALSAVFVSGIGLITWVFGCSDSCSSGPRSASWEHYHEAGQWDAVGLLTAGTLISAAALLAVALVGPIRVGLPLFVAHAGCAVALAWLVGEAHPQLGSAQIVVLVVGLLAGGGLFWLRLFWLMHERGNP
jgi:hypothetical protein